MHNKSLRGISLIALGSLSFESALAQSTAALEEIIVTAQKTAESIQEVPISITALDEVALERNGVTNIMDLSMLVPSLTVRPNPVSDQNLQFTLRGVADGAIEVTQDRTTALHLNGIYIARGNGLNLNVADLERVEVLRGPQGTLYGRNATAGAINYITRKPGDEFEFRQQFTAGNFDRFVSRTTINVPITDTLAIRANYLLEEQDGWIDNSFPGGAPINDREADAYRVDVRWEPTDNLVIDYGYDRSEVDYYSQPFQCTTLVPGFLGSIADPATCNEDEPLDDLSLRGNFVGNEVWASGHTLSVAWDFSENHSMRALLGYREYEDNYQAMLQAGGAGLTGASGLDTTEEFALIPPFQYPTSFVTTEGDYSSVELQFFGTLNDSLSYNAGLYWFDENGTEINERATALVVWPGQSPLVPTGFVAAGGPRDLNANNQSQAAYLEITWTPEFFDGKLDIIPGIRYTEDERDASLYNVVNGDSINDPDFLYTGEAPPTSGNIADIGTPAQYENDFSEMTPSLILRYHLNEGTMLYGKYIEGYRSGGTAIRATPVPGNQIFEQGFDPETITSIEAGVKADFMDSRLRLNANVFLSEFEDQQITVRNTSPLFAALPSPPFDIFNVGESSQQGLELEASFAFTPRLRVDVNYAYLDYEYDSVEDPGTGANIEDFFHFLPAENSASISLSYRNTDFEIAGVQATLDASLNWSYEDEYEGTSVDDYSVNTTPGPNFGTVTPGAKVDRENFRNPSFDIFNARIALSDMALFGKDNGRLGFAIWARNLTNEEYSLMRSPIVASLTPSARYWAEPRTFGADLDYRF